ncbi:trypsin-like serine peptidase [Streptomyces clavuligerus]|uniref:Lipoprotein n=1 Tax=Streptomyces clavuligerus TaxID=1901 RepID=D5SKD9_STRCL|nr:hypothetical protein [Streptomyces clavuligerus]ANW22309.1 hypothetical protein BB341_28670 [Streptomyces clavuligerus]AXU17205.1 hypothetical protein D1794_31755 [Streptomyces clavuligerus]EFG04382.1 Hypothetical protein SCLAV_p0895 [Streptomyces clavuligerus]MBY6307151.1 hypothetical protein [Streptomyces clavuligerus]QCS10273.1 hypothetical protein CRV15_32450 [Streptomyces clavuligerus]
MRRTRHTPVRRTLLPAAALALALGSGGLAQAGGGTEAGPPVAATATAAATTAATTGTAAATEAAAALLLDGTRIASASSITALERYWTSERMAKALPARARTTADDISAVSPGRQEPTGKPGSTPPVPPAQHTRDSGVRDGVQADTSGVGKVFYTSPADSKNYFCSASALGSPSKQLVITAAHCVNEGGTNGTPGRYVRNWVYVPAFHSGTRPHGTFQAKEFRAFSEWVARGDLQYDIAMVTTHPLNGRKLIDVTGGNGLSWNQDHRQRVTVTGYSYDHDTARTQRSCPGTASPVGAPDRRVEIRCAMRGGGAPWLRNPVASGLGHVNGVVSTLVNEGWNRSSYFGEYVKAMWDTQGSRT